MRGARMLEPTRILQWWMDAQVFCLGSFTATGSMTVPRESPTATLLSSAKCS
jgi:hypothetical protein